MVTIERRVGQLLRYRKVWYPAHNDALNIATSIHSNDVVRLFAAPVSPRDLPRLVAQRPMKTAWLDLAARPEVILDGMKRKSCRHEIRRAERMLGQVNIEVGTARSFQDFLTVYNDFALAKKLPKFRPSWLQEYAACADIFVLYLKAQPLCCHLLLRDSQRSIVRLLYSGSRRLRSADDASACGPLNRYLHWHEMQHYKGEGYATYDFGGIRDPADSISLFKLSFGARVVTEHYGVLGGIGWFAKLANNCYEKIRRIAPRPKEFSSAQSLAIEAKTSVSGLGTRGDSD